MPSDPLLQTEPPDLLRSWLDGLSTLRNGDGDAAENFWLDHFIGGQAEGQDRSALLLWNMVRNVVRNDTETNLLERLDEDRIVCESFARTTSLYDSDDMRQQAVRSLAGSFSVAKAALLWDGTRSPDGNDRLASCLREAVEGYASFWQGHEVSLDAGKVERTQWAKEKKAAWDEAKTLVSQLRATKTDDDDAVAVGQAMVCYGLGWLLDVLPVPSDADRRQTSVVFAYGVRDAALARLQLDRCPWSSGEGVLFPDPVSLGLRLLDEDWRRSFERARKAGIEHGPKDKSPASGDVAWRLVFEAIPPQDSRDDSDPLPPGDPSDIPLLEGPSASGAAALAWAALANGRPLDAGVCLTADVKDSGALFAVGGLRQKLNGKSWELLRQSTPVQAALVQTVLVGWKDQEGDKDEAHERVLWQTFGKQARLRVGFPKLLTEVIDEACGRLEAVLTFLDQLALNGLKEHVIYLPPQLKSGEGDPDQPDSHVTLTDLMNFCLPVRVVDEQEWQRLERERSSPKPTHGPDDRDYIFAQSEEFWRMDGEQRATPRRLEAVLATNRRTVLRGEPGEGKTTSLFLHVARCCRELADNLRKGSLGLDNADCRVPLPLPLSKAAPTKVGQRFSAVRRARNDTLRLAFGSAKRAPLELATWLDQKVERGEIDLCLDALDELDPRWHDELRMELERHSAAGVFLTTRLSADDSKVIRNARRFRMVCFGPAQVRDYTQRYFAHVENGEQLIGELRDRLRQSPGPRQLAQIPLLLALLCEWLSSRREWPIEKLREEMPKTRTKLLEFALHRLLERGDARRGNPVVDSPSQRNQIKEAVLRHVAWRFFATGPLPVIKNDLMPVLEQQLERAKWKVYLPPQNAEALLEEYLQDGVIVRQDQGVYRFVLRSLHEYCLAGWIAAESPPIISNNCAAFERMIRGRADLWSDLANRTGDVKPLNQPAWENVWPYVLGQLGPKAAWLLEALWNESQENEDIHSSRLLLLVRTVGASHPNWQCLDKVVTRLMRIVKDERYHGDLALRAVKALADLEEDRAQDFLADIADGHRRNGDQRVPIAAYRGVVQHNRSRAAPPNYPSPTVADAIVSLGSHSIDFGNEFGSIVADIADEEHRHALLALIQRPAMTSETHVEHWEQRLHGECAIAFVRAYGEEAIATVRTLMNDEDFPMWSRRNFAEAMAANGDDGALPILEQWMSEARNRRDFSQPCHAIARLGTEAAATFVLRYVTDPSESASVRGRCAYALGDTCNEHARTTLLSLLRNLSEHELHLDCVHAFGHALGHLKQAELHETLLHVVCSPRYHDVVRGCCAGLLATHKATPAANLIVEQMSDSDTSEYLRIQFAIALGKLGDKRALQWLAKYLLSPTVAMHHRESCAEALAVIGDQSARDILIAAMSEVGKRQGMGYQQGEGSQVAMNCAWDLAEIADEAAWSAVVRHYKSGDAGSGGCPHALDLMRKRTGRRLLVTGETEKA